MISISTESMPSIWRGMSARVYGRVCSSLRQGIWTISFMAAIYRGSLAPRLQGRDEFICRYVGLTQNTCQRAYFDFAMHGDDTSSGAAAQDDVATGLAQLFESQALQCPYYGSARHVRQLRHTQER